MLFFFSLMNNEVNFPKRGVKIQISGKPLIYFLMAKSVHNEIHKARGLNYFPVRRSAA